MTLLHGEDHYRTLVEFAPDVLYGLSTDGAFTALSPAFEEITGWAVKDWIGKPFAGLIHPDDLLLATEKFEANLRGITPSAYELRIRSVSGEYLIGEIRGIPKLEDGVVVGSVGIARDVTARWRAERRLQESRDQLQAILQSVDDGITVQRPDGKLVYANAEAARIIGYSSPEELLAADIPDIMCRFELLDDNDESLPLQELPNRRALLGERPAEMLVRFRIKGTHEEHTAILKSTPVLDDREQVQFAVSVFHDVTDRCRAEIARQQLAAIVESSEDAIIGKNLNAIITNWNPAAERLYGYRADEVVGKSVAILVPVDMPQELPSIMARVARGEPIQHYETVRVRKDGQQLNVWLSVSPIRDSEGRIVGAATIARDNTERMNAERERSDLLVRERKARAEAEVARSRLEFLARASDILSSSLEYEKTLSNLAKLAVPALGDWCIIELREEDGSLRRIALSHQDPEKVALAREPADNDPPVTSRGSATVLQTGESQLVEEITDEMIANSARDEGHLALIRSLGLTSAMVVPLPARGNVIGAITLLAAESNRRYGPDDLELAEDMGRRAAVAVDNARLYKQAQDALRLREEFLSIASHELKTPLTSLQLQIQILDRFVRQESLANLPPSRATSILDGAGRQIKRLSKLINDLLDVSRVTTGRLELEEAEVDLGHLAAEVVERFHEESVASETPIVLHSESGVIGRWDPFRIDQVLTNLVANAIKYGGSNPIDVHVTAADGHAHVSVQDAGIGIAPEHLTRIFDRFERMLSARSYGGLGLGLYIVRQIVEIHGGTIDVESRPGEGSIFTVKLPLLGSTAG